MGFNRPKKPVPPFVPKSKPNLSEQIVDTINNTELEPIERKAIEWDKVHMLSTHSTLLDLAISGGRVENGGIPACILAEVHGPSGSGKTAILTEVGSSAQKLGGDVEVQDPESRMDKEYAKIYEFSISQDNYHRPEKVEDVFAFFKPWQKLWKPNVPHVLLTDSLAALTTELEMETGDLMGMRRAKEFSSGCRINARQMGEMLWLCSNQERQKKSGGFVVPGGDAIHYYSSLVIRAVQYDLIKLKKKNAYGVEIEEIIGIKSKCEVRKSTIDDPYRTAPICIVFGLGIDDVRANLQYLKDMQGLTTYPTPNGKRWQGMEQAIQAVEENDLKKELKKQTITMWQEIRELFNENKKRTR